MSAVAATNEGRWDAACHEARHIVMAYWVGWSLRATGARIDPEPSADIDSKPAEDTPWRMAFVAFAGFQSPHLNAGKPPLRSAAGVGACLARARGQANGADSDGAEVFAMLMEVEPSANDAKLCDLFRRLERATWAEVSKPTFAAIVDRIASALFERGSLTPEEVVSLLPWAKWEAAPMAGR